MMVVVVVLTGMLLIPGPVTLQSVENILTVRIDKFGPRLPQRLNDEVDEPDLQEN